MESSSTNTSTPLFWCNICRVSCLSALNLHMHFMGAKHKKVEESLKNCGGEQLWPFSVDDISSDDEAQPGTLEEQLNACKTTTPALGLEYIYEYQPFEGGFSKYECRLCNMQSGLSSMFMHIVGAKHRISYLSKHHPGMDIPISFRAKNPAKIKKLVDACSAVENEFGRKNITVLLGSYVPASDKYSKDPRASPDIDYQKEKSQQKGKSKKQKVTFQELKKAHEANLKNPQTSADTGQCSDQDVGNCNLDEFLCNEELFDFLDHFKIKCEDDVTFVLKVTERFNKAIIIQKERHEEFKKKMAYVNPDTSSAAVVTPQTLSHIPSEEKTISNPAGRLLRTSQQLQSLEAHAQNYHLLFANQKLNRKFQKKRVNQPIDYYLKRCLSVRRLLNIKHWRRPALQNEVQYRSRALFKIWYTSQATQ
ncbi:stress response NST1-like [Pelobates cultripes]|uniref:Stress response NST1-like n=1 Tax=Pelobates cultripes TaxID=61616 RepID=A0AAD1RZC6_PELCU|nr:stress response NST1-like [Pelobates cultripes]